MFGIEIKKYFQDQGSVILPVVWAKTLNIICLWEMRYVEVTVV